MKVKKHLEPSWMNYNGGYDSLTICQNCGIVGLRRDQHPVEPCRFCGGEVKDHIEGERIAGKWIKATYKYKFLFFGKVKIKNAHWKLSYKTERALRALENGK